MQSGSTPQYPEGPDPVSIYQAQAEGLDRDLTTPGGYGPGSETTFTPDPDVAGAYLIGE